MKILNKNSKNYIRNKNRYFKVIFLIYIYIYIIYHNNIIYMDKKYKFYKCTFIKLHYIYFTIIL